MNLDQYAKPLPKLEEWNLPFFQRGEEGQLVLQYCQVCEAVWYPPRRYCSRCLSGEVEWRETSGRGTLWSWVIMHRKYFASFAQEIPYVVAMIRLDEGPYLVASMSDVTPEELSCDKRVSVVFSEIVPHELYLPKFTLDVS